MTLFPPYYFAIFAIITFVIGYCLSWFTKRPVVSIGLGVGGVIFLGLFVLDWTIPGQPANPVAELAIFGAVFALAGGIPALFGAAVARNLKKVVLK